MADENRIIETRTDTGGISSMAFILGGLVVAVGVIAWLVFGGGIKSASVGSGDKTSITIQNPAPATAAPAPATAAAAAPATPAPAPAVPAPAAPAP